MKVAQFIGKCGPGGAESMALNLARKFAEIPTIESIVYTTEMVDNDWTLAQLQGANVEIIVLPGRITQYWKVTSMLQFGYGLSVMLDIDKVTHLHSHMYPQILRGAVAAKMAKAKVKHIGTLHDVYSLLDKPARIRWLKAATASGTKLVSVSNNMNETYHKVSDDFMFCSLPKDNPQVIYNGVDTHTYFPRECEKQYEFEMVSVGRLADVKNYSMLLNAMSRLINSGMHDAHLTLIGDGEERQHLEALAHELVIEEYVTFVGSRDDVPELLCTADLFVLPSKSEGLSCSILEAMASGLPILATDVGGNKELVSDNGALVPSDCDSILAEKIFEMRNGKLLPAMGKRSIEKVYELFSYTSMVNSYLELYSK